MKSWKPSALALVALLWGTSAIAAQPIRASQPTAIKASPAAALSLAPRAGGKMQRSSKLDGGEFGILSIAAVAAVIIAGYFFYTEVIDDDDEPASP